MWSFFPADYTGFTHSSLRAWGNQNVWGVYSNPGKQLQVGDIYTQSATVCDSVQNVRMVCLFANTIRIDSNI